MVGISLLTLVPGVVGGSETYARELVRALARVGELEYRVFTTPLAPDAADGLPAQTGRPPRPGCRRRAPGAKRSPLPSLANASGAPPRDDHSRRLARVTPRAGARPPR